jgi:hypothetical protein
MRRTWRLRPSRRTISISCLPTRLISAARSRLAGGRDDARRLVDRPDLERLGADRGAVDADVVARADVAGGIGDDLAADGDPAGGDDLLRHAA